MIWKVIVDLEGIYVSSIECLLNMYFDMECGLVVSCVAPNGVDGGFDSFPSYLVGYKLRSREQVVIQLRGMHPMIDATL